ncbi:MAG TPA: alpha/beta fold hydrolase, partial [Mycobacteriales bacterium]
MGGKRRVPDPRGSWRSVRLAIWRTMRGRPRWQRATALTALVAAATTVVTVGVTAARGPRVETHQQRITVLDGPGGSQRVSLDATLFVPDGVDSGHRAPAVLMAHGFGGSKDDVRADAEDLAGNGYVVLTYSARGFGHSTGQVAVDSPDYEVSDARQLVDWLAARPEVRLDAPGDPRIGVTGASYGGALSLLLAGYDRRVDAIVPVATWNDLSHAFFPDNVGGNPGPTPAGFDQRVDDGVFKRLWAANFFTSGAAPTRPAGGSDTTGPSGPPGTTGSPGGSEQDALCGRFVPAFCHVYQQAARTGRATEAAVALLRRSSPAPVLDRIHAPTLLIQGETDSLFPLSEADANARGIAVNGTPVKMVWFPGGHDAGAGLADADRLRSLTTTWFDHYLRGTGPAPERTFEYSRITPASNADTGGPRFRNYVATGYPGLGGENDNATRRRTVTLRGQTQTVLNPAGGAPAAVSGLPGLGDAVALAGALGGDLPGQSARFDSAVFDRTFDLVGAPTVRIRVSASTDQAVLFAKLYDVDQQGHGTLPQRLVAPVRVGGLTPGQTRTVNITLPAVVHRFESGHRMRLVLASTDQGYATPADPAAYQVSLVDGSLFAPQVSAVRSGRDGSPLPWLVGGAIV